MSPEEWEVYKEKGYAMDAYVGKDGLEKVFESELHGTDGLLRTTVDRDGNVIPDATDSCSFYAVLFEGSEPLDGTNSSSSERIVCIAKYNYETPISSTTYTRIALPFVYRREMPQNTTLQYSIIASSSAKGDLYQGAAGSQLLLDKVEIKLKQSGK